MDEQICLTGDSLIMSKVEQTLIQGKKNYHAEFLVLYYFIHMIKDGTEIKQGRSFSFVSKFVHRNQRLEDAGKSDSFRQFHLTGRYLKGMQDKYWSTVTYFVDIRSSRPTERPILLCRQGPVRHTPVQYEVRTARYNYTRRDGTTKPGCY